MSLVRKDTMNNYNYPIIIGMRDSNGFSDKYVDIGMSKRIKSNLSVIIGDLKTPCKAGETIDVSDIDSPRVELMFCNKQSFHIFISALQQAERLWNEHTCTCDDCDDK